MTVKFDDLDSVSLPTPRRFPLITPAMVRRHQPCARYQAAGYLEKLLGGGKTPLQVLEYEGVPLADRLWLLERVLDETTLRLMSITAATSALNSSTFDDGIPQAALEIALRYALGDASKREINDARCVLMSIIGSDSIFSLSSWWFDAVLFCTYADSANIHMVAKRATQAFGSERPVVACMRKVLQFV